jgi:hypothetical protein
VKKSGGHYFHYGHARHPKMAAQRLREAARLWHDDATVEKMCDRPAGFYEDDQKVKPFIGTHPAVMRDIVAAADWTYHSRNPLLRLNRRYFWKDVALLVKKITGTEIGVHRNFRLIR